MRRILCTVFIIIFIITGCSNEKKSKDNTIETVQPNEDLNIADQNNADNSSDNTSDNSSNLAKHVLDNALKDSMRNSDGDEIVLKDKLFIAQCNDIYLNPDEYMDKTIRWEGIYTESTNPETKEIYKFVIRLGPGCCGNDGTAGFEVLYDGEMPKENDWVEAVGKIEMIEEDGNEFIAIRLSKLTVLDVRGQEFVSN